MSLTRWDPFTDMLSLRDAMDQLFEESFIVPRTRRTRNGNGNGSNVFYQLPVDVRETEEAFVVEAIVPGLSRDDLSIEFQNGQLSISGEVAMPENPGTYHLRERWAGKFHRSLRFPTLVDADNIEATLEQGVLTLTLPKAEAAKPRRIEVKSSGN